jgi:hypothetical protein
MYLKLQGFYNSLQSTYSTCNCNGVVSHCTIVYNLRTMVVGTNLATKTF